ncbi:hypothetical protein FKM82_030750 [Ascaphus truei]
MEKVYMEGYNPIAILHAKESKLTTYINNSLLIHHTKKAWRTIRKQLLLDSEISQFIPIQRNREFPECSTSQPFFNWREKGLTKITQLIEKQGKQCKSFQELKNIFSIDNRGFFCLYSS